MRLLRARQHSSVPEFGRHEFWTITLGRRVYRSTMDETPHATDEDRRSIIGLALGGLALGRSIEEIARDLVVFDRLAFPSTARVLADLAADALALAGGTRANPVAFRRLEHHLPDYVVRGNVAHQKRRAAFQIAVMTYAGIEPDYDGDAGWWTVQDLARWMFLALVVVLRVTAERSGRTLEDLCRTVAAGREVAI
jgi:hypothetical protein